jgi:hypothetical protein
MMLVMKENAFLDPVPVGVIGVWTGMLANKVKV